MCGGNVSLPFANVKSNLEPQEFSGVFQNFSYRDSARIRNRTKAALREGVAPHSPMHFGVAPHRFHLWLDWRADTLRETDRKSVNKTVDKQVRQRVDGAGRRETPTSCRGWERRYNSIDNSQLSLHHCQSVRAPTRTRTWNPLIKRVERFRHCELGSNASSIAVESGADNERARYFISLNSSLSSPLPLARHG